MIRISATEFIRNDKVHFDSETVDSILDTLCLGEYMPIWDIGSFLQFPDIGTRWNGFVLECYLKKYSRLFRLEQASGGMVKSGYYALRNDFLRKMAKFWFWFIQVRKE